MRGDQGGFSVALFPLMLMMLGSALLGGVQAIQDSQYAAIGREREAMILEAQALSALAWGLRLSWSHQQPDEWRCQPGPKSQGWVCLRRLEAGVGLLAASALGKADDAPIRFWQAVTIRSNRVAAMARGWSDFCPLEASLCAIPQ